MDVLKTLAKSKALKWKLFKYGKIEELQAQEVDMMSYYQEGVNFGLMAKPSALSKPCEN
jgi:hypothetical protein